MKRKASELYEATVVFASLPMDVLFEIWRRLTLKDLLLLRRLSTRIKTLVDANIWRLSQYLLPATIYRDMSVAHSYGANTPSQLV